MMQIVPFNSFFTCLNQSLPPLNKLGIIKRNQPAPLLCSRTGTSGIGEAVSCLVCRAKTSGGSGYRAAGYLNACSADTFAVRLRSSTASTCSSSNHCGDVEDNLPNVAGDFAHISSLLLDDTDAFEVEEKEPAKYVPPPSIDPADLELNRKVENLLYTLKDLLPGPVNKCGFEREKCFAARNLFHFAVEVQDPLVCMTGITSLQQWLKILATTGAMVQLHEIYIQNSMAFQLKRWVYAVWTLSFTESLARLSDEKLPNWWRQKYISLFKDIYSSQNTLRVGEGLASSDCSNATGIVMKLSGETKFEIDDLGQVVSIQSSWYARRGEKELFEAIKAWLAVLLYKDAN